MLLPLIRPVPLFQREDKVDLQQSAEETEGVQLIGMEIGLFK